MKLISKERRKKMQLWIYLKLMSWKVKVVRKCIIENRDIVVRKLRDDFDEYYKSKDDRYKIDLSVAVSFKLLPIEDLKEDDFNRENEVFIWYETQKFIKDNEIQQRRILHFRLSAYYWDDISKERADKYLAEAKELDKSVKSIISHKEFEKIRKLTHKQYREKYRQFKKQVKYKREQIELSKVAKVNISFDQFKIFLALFSVLFLGTGFVYNHLFLGYFGIELSKFFNIADYLASSADKIFYSLVSVFVALAIGLFCYPEYLRGEPPEGPKSKWASRVDNIIYKSIIPLASLGVIITYLQKNQKGFYQSLYLLLFFFSIYIMLSIILPKNWTG